MITLEFLRSYKIFGFAIFDLTVSYLGIYLLALFLSKIFLLIRLDIPRSSWLYFTLPLSILVHILVGQYTPMTKEILDPSGHYFLKVFLLILLILGISGIKIRS